FDITNYGEDRVIEIVGQGQRYGGPQNTGTITVRQEVALRRGDHRYWTIPVPVGPQNGGIQFEVREGGRTLETFNYIGLNGAFSPVTRIVATAGSVHESVAQGWLRNPSSRAYAAPGTHLDFILDPRRLPESWLAYTSLRAVLIAPSEWSKLSEPQQNA